MRYRIRGNFAQLLSAVLFLAASSAIDAATAAAQHPKVHDIYDQPYGAAGPNAYPTEFRELADKGLAQLKRGDIAVGISTLIKASHIGLRYAANYELWDEIAQAKCKAGEDVAGRLLLKEYRCMVKMNKDQGDCYVGDINPVPNADLTPLCFRYACGDGWDPSSFQLGGGQYGEGYDYGDAELVRVDKLIKACRAPRMLRTHK